MHLRQSMHSPDDISPFSLDIFTSIGQYLSHSLQFLHFNGFFLTCIKLYLLKYDMIAPIGHIHLQYALGTYIDSMMMATKNETLNQKKIFNE